MPKILNDRTGFQAVLLRKEQTSTFPVYRADDGQSATPAENQRRGLAVDLRSALPVWRGERILLLKPKLIFGMQD
jgi:hypothetical protein